MFLGILNAAVVVFVATSSDIATRDKEVLVKFETVRFENYTRYIQEFFAEADTDKSGMLSWEEFGLHLQNDKVKAYFQSLELGVTQAHLPFRLPDVDGSNEVSFMEFLLEARVIFRLTNYWFPRGLVGCQLEVTRALILVAVLFSMIYGLLNMIMHKESWRSLIFIAILCTEFYLVPNYGNPRWHRG